MKPEEIKVVIGEVDGLIRKGEGNAAQKRLLDLAKGRLPRPQLLPVAVLMRRAGLPDWGIRLLNPIIRTTSKALSTATEAEKAEYAASLTRIGATQEALRILSGLNATSTPEALLFQSIAQFTLWDYAAALPLLARFVATPSISDYQRLVGSVNLLAALIHEKHFERADGLLKQLLERTKTPELNLLHGNILELAAQNAIFHADWKAADGYIQQSEAALSNTNTMDAFYTRKWRAVLALMQAPNKEASRSGLENVRREARERRHWETLRDCDYFEAIARRDGALGARLYFGTPYVAYRERLARELGAVLVIPRKFVWRVGPRGKVKGQYDLLLGGEEGEGLKDGQLPHRLLTILASDFYRPHRVATICDLLYPNQFFNPRTSPLRVHQVILRLRRWFDDEGLPMTIDEEAGRFRLQASVPFELVLAAPFAAGKARSGAIAKLSQAFGKDPFSVSRAMELLGGSESTTLRLLKRAVEDGDVRVTGQGKNTRYLFP